MSCPTCDHTMQNLGVKNGTTYWCPRCGTLRWLDEFGTYQKDTLPSFLRTSLAYETNVFESDGKIKIEFGKAKQ